jgi:hypothetical protein
LRARFGAPLRLPFDHPVDRLSYRSGSLRKIVSAVTTAAQLWLYTPVGTLVTIEN